MGAMTKEEWDEISESIVIWTGRKTATIPVRDASGLASVIGVDATAKMLPILKKLEAEFYGSDARYIARGLPEMYNIAVRQFRDKYPLLSDTALDALGWCYTWDYK